MTITPADAQETKWYVMAAYKFELKAEASLREAGLEVYLPKETVYIKKPRRRPIAVERPAISTLIFVHASWSAIIDYKRRIDDRLKFRMTPIDGHLDYLTVPPRQMSAFISIWTNRDTLRAILYPITDKKATVPIKTRPSVSAIIKPGTEVEITEGPLTDMIATTVDPVSSRTRITRLSLPISSILSITVTLPTHSFHPLNSNDHDEITA